MELPKSMDALRGRQKPLAVALVAIILLAGAGFAVSRTNKPTTELIDFDYERCYEDVKALTSLGPRKAGTWVEKEATDYIMGEMLEAGLTNVHIEEVTVPVIDVDRAALSLVKYRPLLPVEDPTATPIEFAHMQDFVVQGYSGSAEGDFEVTYAGSGANESDFEGSAGTAVMVTASTQTPSNPTLHQWATSAGAEVLVVHNNLHDSELGYPPIFKGSARPDGWPDPDYPDIPFVMVSKDAGDQIAEAGGEWRLRIDFRVIIEERPVRSVMGEIEGSSGSGDYVMLGAHLDTVYNGLGAVDNTVGTATVIEVGRQLARYSPRHTIRFAAWSGEEEGLFGSIGYVDAHAQEVEEHCLAYLNLDMNNVDLERDTVQPVGVNSNKTLARLESLSRDLLREEPSLSKYEFSFYWSEMYWGSDQAPFAYRNVTVASAWGSGSLEYHTYLDTLERVNPESQQLAGKVMGTYALELAGG